jgi:16S rRNA (cytidine1402-2'-O)-methyltransferase
MTTLYIVATPIGNLEDISMRAIRILGEVDFVLCEDTRVTKKLLNHYNIGTYTISYHQHSTDQKVNEIMALLDQGKNLAGDRRRYAWYFRSGGRLVAAVIDHFSDDVKIESVPGPSTVTAALSISGVPADKLVFFGFPPHKKGRQTLLKRTVERNIRL